MKEKFLDEQQRRDAEMQNQYLDDDYCCGQQCGCHEENEANTNAAEYDAWWDSLTDDQKDRFRSYFLYNVHSLIKYGSYLV